MNTRSPYTLFEGIIGPIKKSMLEQGRYTSKYFTEDYQLYERTRQGRLESIKIVHTTLEEQIGCDDKLFLDFLRSLLTIDPIERPTALEALSHPWFSYEDPDGANSEYLSVSGWSNSTT